MRASDKAIILQIFLDVLPRSSNILVDKVFNLFDECAVKYTHLSPEEECDFFLRGQ